MEPLRIYDYLTRARQRIFDRVRLLDAEQYARDFPIGPGTLGRTLTHILISEWYYVQRIREREVPPYEAWPIREDDPPPFETLETSWLEQANDTRTALDAVQDWNARFEYCVTRDGGRQEIATTTAADMCTQLVLHEVHHRAQAMNMLFRLGFPVEDIDFNALMFDRRPAT